MIDFEVTGFEDLFETLESLAGDNTDVKKRALNQAGTLLKDEMMELSPVNEERKSGKHMNETVRKSTKMVYGEMNMKVYPTKFYDMFAEWGTSKTPPTFFVENTWMNKKDEAAAIVSNKIMKWIERKMR